MAVGDECPREMIERGAEVIGDIAYQQAPAERHRGEVGHNDREAVAFRVVLRTHGAYWMDVGFVSGVSDVVLERLGVDYAAQPLEPRAIEQRLVGHSLTSPQMAEDDPQQATPKTQQTKPAKGKPIEIPVPKREDIEGLIDRAAKPLCCPPVPDQSKDHGQASEDH
jgi:hypothetical protein